MTDARDPFGPHTRFCARCNARMKSAIQAHGLWPRVSKTPAELQARLARCDPYDPDPLMLLHNMVFGKARHMAALNDVTLGHVAVSCPVCFFDVPEWIEEAAAAVFMRVVSLDQEKLDDIVRNERLAAEAQSL